MEAKKKKRITQRQTAIWKAAKAKKPMPMASAAKTLVAMERGRIWSTRPKMNYNEKKRSEMKR